MSDMTLFDGELQSDAPNEPPCCQCKGDHKCDSCPLPQSMKDLDILTQEGEYPFEIWVIMPGNSMYIFGIETEADSETETNL